ncbi:EboA domain-containing protein [Chitinophaga horti]|uniref:EboA domain-containing protein n=1 Tax=Chitinophaga horti TaxID=2920382 RepID=A0ABY6IXV7_9BACT|nr:EboA domain-containing protein [Chitinophaga horti]UYQ92083.1 EboA domain-containing protein [Chitinophaga horti]
MDYVYDKERMSALLYQIVAQQAGDKAELWLRQKAEVWQQSGALQQFNLTFSAIPRFIGKNQIIIDSTQEAALKAIVPGFSVQGWPADRVARAWWLLQLPVADKTAYVKQLETLFDAAEMNELAALYGALPLLAFPEEWTLRTAEGIRSNIGTVQEAIMLNNPYPALYLSEAAWNQLVMKAIFTDKQIGRIIGLDERANAALAAVLTDYAHERWAAGRTVNPMLWRLVGPFVNETSFSDIKRVWNSENTIEREAAALACAQTTYAPAIELLRERPALKAEIDADVLNWNLLSEKLN